MAKNKSKAVKKWLKWAKKNGLKVKVTVIKTAEPPLRSMEGFTVPRSVADVMCSLTASSEQCGCPVCTVARARQAAENQKRPN